MKEFLNRFSFGDFVAYFLPGLTMVGAIGGLLDFTPFHDQLARFVHEVTLVNALLVACAAYVTGAIVSGMGARLLPLFYTVTRWRKFSDPRDGIEPKEFAVGVRAAFDRIFPFATKETWSPSHFYLLRSAVHHSLPHAAVECSRQNSLMQLRENLLLPVLTWSFVGILMANDRFGSQRAFAVGLGAASLLGAYLITGRIALRAVENRRREVREACLGFLVAERIGLFQRSPTDRVEAMTNGQLMATHLEPTVVLPTTDTVGTA